MSDFGDLLNRMGKAMKKAQEENLIDDEIEYPLEISGVKKKMGLKPNKDKVGSLVKIRPCADEYGDKTYLGIYIGDFPIDLIHMFHKPTKELRVTAWNNPAIYVFALKKVIYGCESWWAEISDEEMLDWPITDEVIENVWYVKALKAQIQEKQTDGSV